MSSNRLGHEVSGIRNVARKRLVDEVLMPQKTEGEWKILVLDEMSLRIISICFKTEEVMACNIALIENLAEERESVPFLKATYMLTPQLESVEVLKSDFSDDPKYKAVHLFFICPVPQDIFTDLTENLHTKYVESFKEIDMLFLPYESQVYSLHDTKFFTTYFDAYREANTKLYEDTAKRLVSLFLTLNRVPMVRYRRAYVKNLLLAELVEKEIENHKHLFLPTSDNQENSRHRCVLLILDRGFDSISPIIREFTFQAMAYDILNIKDDIFVHSIKAEEEGTADYHFLPLSEDDALWRQFRHEHIANVARMIQNMIEADQALKHTKDIESKFKSLPEIADDIKQHLRFKYHERFYTYRHMANRIMQIYCEGLNLICNLEQTLAMRKEANDRPAQNVEHRIMEFLTNETIDTPQKLRLLLLYIFYHKGIKREKFNEILQESGLSYSSASTVSNILHLEIDLFKPGLCDPYDKSLFDLPIEGASEFKQSRWTPLLKPLMTNIINGKLSEEQFPYFTEKPELMPVERTGYWCTDKKMDNANYLIIFVAGGITFSEMRSAYEVMEKYSGWEVIVGGDDVLTPDKFIEKLGELRSFITEFET